MNPLKDNEYIKNEFSDAKAMFTLNDIRNIIKYLEAIPKQSPYVENLKYEIDTLEKETMQIRNIIYLFDSDIIEIDGNIFIKPDYYNAEESELMKRYGKYSATKIKQNGRILTISTSDRRLWVLYAIIVVEI